MTLLVKTAVPNESDETLQHCEYELQNKLVIFFDHSFEDS